MNSYQLVRLLPEKSKSLARLALENARNELQDYVQKSQLSLTQLEIDTILLSVLSDFIQRTFVESKGEHDNAFKFLSERKVRGFSRGSQILSPTGDFSPNWNQLIRHWRSLSVSLTNLGMPPLGSISEKVDWLVTYRG